MFNKERTYDTPIGKLSSVTTILATINKPFLIPWVKKEAREACIEAVLKIRNENPTMFADDAYIRSVMTEAVKEHERVAKKATDIGSIVHGAIEYIIKEGADKHDVCLTLNDVYGERVPCMVLRFFDLIESEGLSIESSEQVVWHPDGFAGTLDLVLYKDTPYGKEYYIGDIKTSKKNKDFPSLDYKLQVEAYRRARNNIGGTPPAIGSCIIRLDKEDDNESAVHWVRENPENLYRVFKSVLDIYNAQKNGVEEDNQIQTATETGIMMGVTTIGAVTVPKAYSNGVLLHDLEILQKSLMEEYEKDYKKKIFGNFSKPIFPKPKRKYTKKVKA